jgi:osmotically-inducible protein OsmY
MKTDSQLQQDVLHELAWESRVTAPHIGVTIEQGVVTLTGTVTSYAERLAAQEAAHRVDGVLDVANELQVRLVSGLARTDSELAQAVRQTLIWNVLVPHDRIQSTVSDGWVTLEGSVDTWHQREDTERAVRHLAGVRGIIDRLQVEAPAVAPPLIQSEIEAALERRADRAARRISVKVHDGTVTLTGAVRTLAEKRAVLGAARGTPGVQAIHDHLAIDLTMA